MSIQEDRCQEKEPKRCIEELAVSSLTTNLVGDPYLKPGVGLEKFSHIVTN